MEEDYIVSLLRSMDGKLDKLGEKVDTHAGSIIRHDTKIEMHHGMLNELYTKFESLSTDVGKHFVEDQMRIQSIEKSDAKLTNWKNNWFNFSMIAVLGGIIVGIIVFSIVKYLGGTN